MDLRQLVSDAEKAAGSGKRLAELVGVAAPTISQMKSGAAQVSPYVATKCAEIAGKNPLEAVLQAHAETDKERRGHWLRLLRRVREAGGLALACLAIGLGGQIEKANASSGLKARNDFIHYANSLCNWLRLVFFRMCRLTPTARPSIS